MANRRELKKDINEEYNKIIEDAYSYMLYNPGKKDEEANAIIDDAADQIAGTMNSIATHHTVEKGKKKSYFKNIRENYRKNTSSLAERVNKLYR